ncbi:hypothetical protein B0T13DRAFT_328686 [Neurospora crassa]|nr:hypothetical protein B0T13DRAFT_328686 [Neurospora crassa]
MSGSREKANGWTAYQQLSPVRPFAPLACRPSQPRNHTVRARPPSRRHSFDHPASQPLFDNAFQLPWNPPRRAGQVLHPEVIQIHIRKTGRSKPVAVSSTSRVLVSPPLWAFAVYTTAERSDASKLSWRKIQEPFGEPCAKIGAKLGKRIREFTESLIPVPAITAPKARYFQGSLSKPFGPCTLTIHYIPCFAGLGDPCPVSQRSS